MVETKANKIKIDIPETSNLWEPKKVGECLKGKYCNRERQDYLNNINYLYEVKDEKNPISDDNGIVAFFGTSVLNDKLGKIKPGYDVLITYKGQKPSPNPQRKPKKLFDVEVWLNPKDPILKKIYPEGIPEDIQRRIVAELKKNSKVGKSETNSKPEESESDSKESPKLNEVDDSEMAAFIQGVEQALKDQNLPLIETNMIQEATDQVGDDADFLNKAEKAINDRGYPQK